MTTTLGFELDAFARAKPLAAVLLVLTSCLSTPRSPVLQEIAGGAL